MHIREPAVAGAFYPMSSSELRNTISKYPSNLEERRVVAAVVPHAGYQYSGKTAAKVYASIVPAFNTVIIIGPNHHGTGGISTDTGSWRTPLGIVPIDEEFVKQLTEDGLVTIDSRAHVHEHSIEVQLPLLQHRFGDFRFVPITVNSSFFDKENMKKLGNKIADVANRLERQALIIASSDFTHYGSNYGYVPFKANVSQTIKKIKDIDMEIAGYATRLMPEKLMEECRERGLTICGYGPIAAAVWAASKLGAKGGEVIDYSTSFEASKDAASIVGYCGIVLF